MKAALFFLVLCLAYTASAISVWCNYKKGNSDDCILPGVGPTYDCGKSAGLSGYQSGTNQKYWLVGSLTSTKWSKFETCCHNAGKGACRG